MIGNRGKASDVRARLLNALALFTEEESDGPSGEQNNTTRPMLNEPSHSHPTHASNTREMDSVMNKPCMHYLWHGHCKIPSCRYLHSSNFETPSPLSLPNDPDPNRGPKNYRKQECQYFIRRGYCGYGDKCKYAHTQNQQNHQAPYSNHSNQRGNPPPRKPHFSQENRGSFLHQSPPPRSPHPRDLDAEKGSVYGRAPDTYGPHPSRRSPNEGMDSCSVKSQRHFSAGHYNHHPDAGQRMAPIQHSSSQQSRGSHAGQSQHSNVTPYPSMDEDLIPDTRYGIASKRSHTESALHPLEQVSDLPHASLNTVVTTFGEVQAILEATSEQVWKLVTAADISDIAALCVYEKRRRPRNAQTLYQGPSNVEKFRQYVMAGLYVLDAEQRECPPVLFYKDARHLAVYQKLTRSTFSTAAGHYPQDPPTLHAEHSFQRCFLPLVYLAVHPVLNGALNPGLGSTSDMLHAFFLVSLHTLVDQFCQCTRKCLESGVLEERQCSSRILLQHDPMCFIPLSFLQVFAPFIHLLDLLAGKYTDQIQRLLNPSALNMLEALVDTWQQKVHDQALPTIESKAAVAAVKVKFAALKTKLAVHAAHPSLVNRVGLM